MQTITYDDALRALNQAVADKGYAYVYPRQERVYCFNVYEGNPDCIVGHALVWLGLPVEWFEKDTRENDAICDLVAIASFKRMFDISRDAVELLRDAQWAQDEGVPWGAAVTRAHLSKDEFYRLGLHNDVVCA